jgi:hypothetical protein
MSFRILDPHPGTAVAAISPASQQAKAIIARAGVGASWSPVESAQFIGVPGILAGMEYHFENHRRHWMAVLPFYAAHVEFIARLREGKLPANSLSPMHPTPLLTELCERCHHEAAAYLNRMAQFIYFAKARNRENLMPRGLQLFVLRNKHTAHRSVDAPRGEDADELISMAFAFNTGFTTIGGKAAHQAYVGQQLVEFIPEADHPTIMAEAVAVVAAIFPGVA